MKRKFVVYPAVVLACCLALIIGLFIRLQPPGYREQARQDFAGPGKIALITDLYEKIETGNPAEIGLVEFENLEAGPFGFPITRALPRDLIPKEFVFPWTGPPGVSGAHWWTVLAHYDTKNRLQAIEFYGSRYGAFISRDPTLRPKMGGDLERITGEPLYITARVTGEPG